MYLFVGQGYPRDFAVHLYQMYAVTGLNGLIGEPRFQGKYLLFKFRGGLSSSNLAEIAASFFGRAGGELPCQCLKVIR